MTKPLMQGPLLGFEQGDYYTVCILTEPMASPPTLVVSGRTRPLEFAKQANLGKAEFWRAEFKVVAAIKGAYLEYEVMSHGRSLSDRHGRNRWQFYVPGKGEQPKIAYASCNGFSSAKLVRDTDKPYALWEKMADTHYGTTATEKSPKQDPSPFALLLMGGDQLYADEIWESKKCPTLKTWSELSWKKQHAAKVSATMSPQVAKFYDEVYLERWHDKTMSLLFASIPSVMMWDDHDIFDGWGSYPDERQNCDVFQAVFKEAARVFDVFQSRCGTRNRLNPDADHRTLRLQFRGYHILALDNRTERRQARIMSEQHWEDVKGWLNDLAGQKVSNLLVMTSVPVVYRSFAAVEAIMDATFWHEELEDDVHDHWSSRPHLAERMRLIMVLLNFLQTQKDAKDQGRCKGVLLSGDVHVGALGQVWYEREELGLTQVISSGIVHPAPTAFAWAGIQLMTSGTPGALGDGEIVTQMLTPFGAPRYPRQRNFVTLQTGTDDKIWVNWVCESETLKPSFAISLVTPKKLKA